MARIITEQEAADLFNDFFKTYKIEPAQGGNAIKVSYGGTPIVIKSAPAVSLTRSTHSNR